MHAVKPRDITTGRLVLEPLMLRHAPAVTRFCRLWEVACYTANIPHPYPAGCAEAFAKDAIRERQEGRGWVYAVIPAEDGRLAGVIDITLSSDFRTGELGYAFAPWSWGKGYATEAARALTGFAFRALRLDMIEAFVMVENSASAGVLAKIGMRCIGERMIPAPAREREALYKVYRMFWSEALK